MDNIEYYILFYNYTEGTKLEKVLKQNKIKYVVSPTPRKLSSFCGISIKYSYENEDKIKRLVEENDITIKGFFSLKKEKRNVYGL